MLLLALALGACGDKKATAIVVAVSTEGRVPEDVSELEIAVERDGQPRFSKSYLMPSDTRVPGTLTLTRDDEDSKSPARVVIRAKDASSKTWRVVREARVGFSEEKTKLLRMPLRFSCFDAADCAAGSTCVGGECQDSAVDVETLPEFAGNDALSRTKDQGGCFDEAKCLSTWQEIPRAAVGADCSFAAPARVGSFNVLVEWSASKGRRVVLDADAREGFTTNGDRIVLAPGVCKALTGMPGARARVLGVATSCPTKAPTDPVCLDAQSPPGSGGAAGAGVGGAGGGTLAGAGGAGGKAGGSGGTSIGGSAGTSGGTMVVNGPDGSKASLPAGSTSQSSSVAIAVATPAETPPIPSQYASTSIVYAFTPHGLTFSKPVTIEVPGASAFSKPLLLTAPPGGPWSEVPAVAVANDLVADVTHFSYFTVSTLLGAGGSGAGGSAGAGGGSIGGAGGAGGGCGDTQSSSSNCGECGYSCGTNACKFGVCAALNLNLTGGTRAVVAADGLVYGASLFGNAVVTAPNTGVPAGGMSTVVATPNRPYALLVDADYVYWHTTTGELGRVPRKGGNPSTIGMGPEYFDLSAKSQGSIVLDGGTFYFTHIGATSNTSGIYTLSSSGGTAVFALPLGTEAPDAILVDPTHVYWATQAGVISRAPKASLATGSIEMLGTMPNGVRALGEDGADLLVASATEVLRMPKSGGPTKVVTTSNYTILSANLVVHGGQVFYGHNGGRVEHAPLGGGAPHTRCDGSGPVQLFSDGVSLFYPTLSANTYRCDLP